MPSRQKRFIFSLLIAALVSVVLMIGCNGEEGPPGDSAAGQTSIIAVGSTEKYVCGDSLNLLVQLVDKFGSGVSGKEVIFTVESGTVTLDPTEMVTDADGMATTSVDTTDLGVDESATVKATLTGTGSTVDFTLTKVNFLGEPAFRLNTMVFDGDIANNELGKLAFAFNPIFQFDVDNGNINQIFVLKDLTKENWLGPTTVIWAALNGLCGAPAGPSTTPCTGDETEFYIDPISYNPGTGEVRTWADGNIAEGDLTVISPGITLVTPVYGVILDIPICDLNIAMTVEAQLTEIAGSRIEATYCPDGCGTIAGAITKANFCKIYDKFMHPMIVGSSCQDVIDLLGLNLDTDCAGEPAFSVRMLYAGTSVTLYEVP